MDRLLPSILVGVILVAALLGMALGWRALRRRQASIPQPLGVPTDLGSALTTTQGLYVATTRADAPLERIAVRGLGFRAKATVAVHDKGLVLALTGSEPLYLPLEHVRGVDRATWAIDKAVEPRGLVRIAWTLGDLDVDSYVRVDEPEELVTAISHLVTNHGNGATR